MATKQAVRVAAPRKHPWTPLDPSSPVVIWQLGRLHPENPAYKMPAGEICICEGQGVKGDPGGQEEGWMVHPYPQIVALIREGRLVEVKPREDTSTLALSDDDLRSLEMSERAVKGLEARTVEGVADLADRLRSAHDPIEWLSSISGIGKATAHDLIEQLQARGLWG